MLMGIIIMNQIMTLHIIFSVLFVTWTSYIGCYLVGIVGVFSTFAGAAYHFFISELIDSLQKVYNPKEISHIKYHFYAVITGLFFSMLAIIIEDIGLDVKLKN